MEKICWSNTDNFEESDVVIIGLPDESQSNSLRMGTAQAPEHIREISNHRDSYLRDNEKSIGFPYGGINSKVFDYGNIQKKEIDEVYKKILSKSKLPILMGGDHSITREIIKSVSSNLGKISLVYFDAHPDFISSTKNYYGSVFYDILPFIDLKSSLQIGIRTPELEEMNNLKKYDVEVITPMDITQMGINHIEKKILEKIGDNVYISFDMDCIDPGFAPGVSVPVPIGLNSLESTYLLKSIVKRGIVGMDIMEVSPRYDITDRTSHLASRMIGEVISSFKQK